MPSFIQNVDAVVKAVGASNVGLVWGLANMNWADEKERDTFLAEITQVRG
jgi:hypothetical protein